MAIKRSRVNIAQAESKKIGALEQASVPAAFCDAVRVETPDCVFLYISGQTPIDDDGNVVAGGMGPQTRRVLERLKRIIEHEGGTMADIVRVQVYVTELSEQHLRDIHAVRNEFFAADARPASTLVEISAIIRAGGLIEIDADAVIAK
jgi:enamine deaminase RidA (YjgF/YER057c/UK114 family)